MIYIYMGQGEKESSLIYNKHQYNCMGKGRNSQQMLIENQTLCDRKEMNLNSSNTTYKISLKGTTDLNVETKHKASKKEHWRVS